MRRLDDVAVCVFLFGLTRPPGWFVTKLLRTCVVHFSLIHCLAFFLPGRIHVSYFVLRMCACAFLLQSVFFSLFSPHLVINYGKAQLIDCLNYIGDILYIWESSLFQLHSFKSGCYIITAQSTRNFYGETHVHVRRAVSWNENAQKICQKKKRTQKIK